MVPVTPMVGVVTAKVKFSLCAYSGNTDFAVVIGSNRTNVRFCVYGYTGFSGNSYSKDR